MNPTDPDGEYFTDVPTVAIPHASSWEQLTPNQLIDVKLKLEDALMANSNRPTIKTVLLSRIAELTQLLSSRRV